MSGFDTPSSLGDLVPLSPPPTSNHESPIEEEQIQRLMQQGYTRSLIDSLEMSKQTFPKRIWIVDNSGSMQKTDGHRMVPSQQRNKVEIVQSSRWEEIQETVDYHIQLAGAIAAPTTFRLLNDPGSHVGPNQFTVAKEGSDNPTIQEEMSCAQEIMHKVRPSGSHSPTSLQQHILDIHPQIREMATTLESRGQQIVLIVATDGLPDDKAAPNDIVQGLKLLQALPVSIVIRLCTDDDKVVSFYNKVVEEMNTVMAMEVLDHFPQEAQEVFRCNPWLNYALPLHRMREMGYYHELFRLLDQRLLTKSELWEFCALLFGHEVILENVPNPNINWDDFCEDIHQINELEEQQWDPIEKTMAPWINMHHLSACYGESSTVNCTPACIIL